MAKGKRYKTDNSGKYIFRRVICCVAALAIVVGAVFGAKAIFGGKNGDNGGAGSVPTEPPKPAEPTVVATALIGSSGDIMAHNPQLTAAKQADGSYDFSDSFQYVSSYYKKHNLFVVNLETSFGVKDNYRGYPTFNSPSSLAVALKGAGVNLAMTCNNHSNDTGASGITNTLEKLGEIGLDNIGSKLSEEEKYYKVKEVGGVKIATAAFSYATTSASGIRALNGLPLNATTTKLVATFDYNKLDEFYAEAAAALEEMKAEGAEFSIIYMHWGNEYQYKPNSYQKQMAQALCDMGWDAIIGSHPHVVQPFETLTRADGGQTVCIYSLGNAVSNQRRHLMNSDNFSGHTEDGMIFSLKVDKWSDGRIELSEVNIIPTWVDLTTVSGKRTYRIVPLDTAVADWSALGATSIAKAKESYNRTMEIAGEGLNAWRTAKGLEAVPIAVE